MKKKNTLTYREEIKKSILAIAREIAGIKKGSRTKEYNEYEFFPGEKVRIKKGNRDDNLLTRKEAGKCFHIDKHILRNGDRFGILSSFLVNKRRRYPEKEIEQLIVLMHEGKVAPF